MLLRFSLHSHALWSVAFRSCEGSLRRFKRVGRQQTPHPPNNNSVMPAEVDEVDEVDQESDGADEEIEGDLLLPVHMKRALARLYACHATLPKPTVLNATFMYCQAYPKEISVPTLVTAISNQLILEASAGGKVGGDDDMVAKESGALEEILSVFPSASVAYVKRLLKKSRNDTALVTNEMIEHGYEKDAAPTSSHRTKVASTVDFASTNWETDGAYRLEALLELAKNFPFLRVKSIESVFVANAYHYSPALQALEKECDVEVVVVSPETAAAVIVKHVAERSRKKPSKESSTALVAQVKATLAAKLSPLIVLTTLRKDTGRDLSHPILISEVQWLADRKRQAMEVSDARMAEELNEQMASAEGALIECGCCYGEYPMEKIIQCSDGHLFCRNCMKSYVEQNVFGNGQSRLSCMHAAGSPCLGYFPEAMLEQALPLKIRQKMTEAATRDALKAASIGDLVTCHNCELEVELEAGSVMHCPQCGLETCKLCNRPAHIPLRCDEVETDAAEKVRHKLEEALTNARVRSCPRCEQRFYKVDGCNKMTCSCGAAMCYVCRADISKVGYGHFNRCCKLMTNTVEDDRQAMLEAGLKELEPTEDAGGPGFDAKQKLLAVLLDGGLPSLTQFTSARGAVPAPARVSILR